MFSQTTTLVSLLTTLSVASAQTYKASFTNYGAGDTFGSGNCNTNTAACGFYDFPGFNAAASQNLFGVGPGAGAGPACGTCWQLTPETDSTGAPISGTKSIIVKVNNLCPVAGNPLCSQGSLTDTNSLGANVNFDLCIDDGAAGQLFGSSGTQLAVGSATQVDCSQYQGTLATTPNNPAVTGPAPSGGAPAPVSSSPPTYSAAPAPVSSSSTSSAAIYSAAPAPPASSSHAAAAPPALKPSSSSAAAPASSGSSSGCGGGSSSASNGVAAHWGQCGGKGWTGPTTCEAPYTCQPQANNIYYSQCL